MAFFSFISKDKDELSLVVDIGSGTLGGALVRFSEGKLPEILYSYREAIIYKRSVTSAELTKSMLRTLDNVCHIIVRDGLTHLNLAKKITKKKVDTVYYSLSSPWVVTETKVLQIRKDKEMLVTPAFIESLVLEEEKNLEKSYKKSDEPGALEADFQIIEKSVVSVSLNGYQTENPFNKKAHAIEIPFLISITSKKLLEKINVVVLKNLHFKNVIAHSCSLLSYISLRDVYHSEKDFLHIDVHGELTDISIVKDGALIQTASLPVGVNTVIRKIAKKLKIPVEVAESQLKMHLSNASEEKHATETEGILSDIKDEWLKLFHKVLESIEPSIVIPQTVFLLSNDSMEKFFSQVLRKESFPKLAIMGERFKVVPLNAEDFSTFETYYKKNDRDSFLALQTIALGRLTNHKVHTIL